MKSLKRGDKEFSRRVKSAPVDELHRQVPVDQSSRAGREEVLRDELCASGAINKRRMPSEKFTEVLRQIRGFHLAQRPTAKVPNDHIKRSHCAHLAASRERLSLVQAIRSG